MMHLVDPFAPKTILVNEVENDQMPVFQAQLNCLSHSRLQEITTIIDLYNDKTLHATHHPKIHQAAMIAAKEEVNSILASGGNADDLKQLRSLRQAFHRFIFARARLKKEQVYYAQGNFLERCFGAWLKSGEKSATDASLSVLLARWEEHWHLVRYTIFALNHILPDLLDALENHFTAGLLEIGSRRKDLYKNGVDALVKYYGQCLDSVRSERKNLSSAMLKRLESVQITGKVPGLEILSILQAHLPDVTGSLSGQSIYPSQPENINNDDLMFMYQYIAKYGSEETKKAMNLLPWFNQTSSLLFGQISVNGRLFSVPANLVPLIPKKIPQWNRIFFDRSFVFQWIAREQKKFVQWSLLANGVQADFEIFHHVDQYAVGPVRCFYPQHLMDYADLLLSTLAQIDRDVKKYHRAPRHWFFKKTISVLLQYKKEVMVQCRWVIEQAADYMVALNGFCGKNAHEKIGSLRNILKTIDFIDEKMISLTNGIGPQGEEKMKSPFLVSQVTERFKGAKEQAQLSVRNLISRLSKKENEQSLTEMSTIAVPVSHIAISVPTEGGIDATINYFVTVLKKLLDSSEEEIQAHMLDDSMTLPWLYHFAQSFRLQITLPDRVKAFQTATVALKNLAKAKLKELLKDPVLLTTQPMVCEKTSKVIKAMHVIAIFGDEEDRAQLEKRLAKFLLRKFQCYLKFDFLDREQLFLEMRNFQENIQRSSFDSPDQQRYIISLKWLGNEVEKMLNHLTNLSGDGTTAKAVVQCYQERILRKLLYNRMNQDIQELDNVLLQVLHCHPDCKKNRVDDQRLNELRDLMVASREKEWSEITFDHITRSDLGLLGHEETISRADVIQLRASIEETRMTLASENNSLSFKNSKKHKILTIDDLLGYQKNLYERTQHYLDRHTHKPTIGFFRVRNKNHISFFRKKYLFPENPVLTTHNFKSRR